MVTWHRGFFPDTARGWQRVFRVLEVFRDELFVTKWFDLGH